MTHEKEDGYGNREACAYNRKQLLTNLTQRKHDTLICPSPSNNIIAGWPKFNSLREGQQKVSMVFTARRCRVINSLKYKALDENAG